MIIRNKIMIYVIFIITLLSASGCTTTYYDAQADQLLTEYAQTSNTQLYKFEREIKSTGEIPVFNQTFYDSLHSDLAVIEIRMSAIQQGEKASEFLVRQFNGLYALIDDIETTHKNLYNDAQKKLTVNQKNDALAYFHSTRGLFNSYLTTLISHETALKNSQSSGDSK